MTTTITRCGPKNKTGYAQHPIAGGGLSARAVLPSSLLLLRFQYLRGHEVVVWAVCRGRGERDRCDGSAGRAGACAIDLYWRGHAFVVARGVDRRIVDGGANCFDVDAEAEVTLEANPSDVSGRYFDAIPIGGREPY